MQFYGPGMLESYPIAPKIFPAAYNLVKHFMDEYTRQKIVVLGGKSPQYVIS